MKTGLFFISILFFISACSQKDTTAPNLNGKWHLVLGSYGLAGYDNFQRDDITWTFRSNQSVDVVINIQLNSNAQLPIEQNGTYNCPSSNNKITINSTEYDYYFEGNDLIISDQPELDGPRYQFEKD